MSPGASANVPVAAFCDTEQEIWGVLVGGSDPLLVLARVAGARAGELLPAQAMLDPDAAVWQVQSAGAALSFSAEPGSSGTLIRCGVTGTCTVGDEQLELAARGVRHPGTDGRAASLRLVTAWFAAGHGAALIARRPPNSSGQDRDVVHGCRPPTVPERGRSGWDSSCGSARPKMAITTPAVSPASVSDRSSSRPPGSASRRAR